MTEVMFHFNVPDKLDYACRLLRKALAAGSRIVVIAEPQSLTQIDRDLWALSATDFLAHCSQGDAPSLLANSPIVLASELEQLPHQQVLLNLGGQVPPGFERFERLIELVEQSDADRKLARSRWKQYAERGYVISRHDVAQQGV